jgi:hypothetical protein
MMQPGQGRSRCGFAAWGYRGTGSIWLLRSGTVKRSTSTEKEYNILLNQYHIDQAARTPLERTIRLVATSIRATIAAGTARWSAAKVRDTSACVNLNSA